MLTKKIAITWRTVKNLMQLRKRNQIRNYEIRDMLVDLQKSVTSILKENSTLREDIKQLTFSLQSKEREVNILKISLGKGSKTNETLKTELQQTKDKTPEASGRGGQSVHGAR